PGTADAIAIADVDRDGHADLLVAGAGGNEVGVFFGFGDGTYRYHVEITPVGNMPHSIASADFNGDGLPDLVTADFLAASVTILLGDGAGKFPRRFDFAVGPGPENA